jgi:hypothetical protein
MIVFNITKKHLGIESIKFLIKFINEKILLKISNILPKVYILSIFFEKVVKMLNRFYFDYKSYMNCILKYIYEEDVSLVDNILIYNNMKENYSG